MAANLGPGYFAKGCHVMRYIARAAAKMTPETVMRPVVSRTETSDMPLKLSSVRISLDSLGTRGKKDGSRS